MAAAVRLVAIVPILAVLGWASVAALNVVRADDLVGEAVVEMGTWAGGSPAPETWTSVRDKVDAALRLRPNDPHSHELLGILGSLRRESPKELGEGLAHLARAVELRPVSPYGWAMLVEGRYLNGEPAAGLELPLVRAAQLGPAEPGVQRLIADYGLAVWKDLRPDARAQVDRLIASGIRRNPLEMLRISDRRGRLEAACRHVVGSPKPDPRVGRYCERWEITP